jgi:sRNA-binding regulator protein Hfq
MPNPSLVPAPGDKHLRVAVSPSVPVVKSPATMPTPAVTGPRKLVRPPLIENGNGAPGRSLARRAVSPLTAHNAAQRSEHVWQESSHAEVFYFQKQVQAQTPMTIVLDDGETIDGVIEWYDRDVIKVRHGGRTLIYKSCIKYLYKSGENQRF